MLIGSVVRHEVEDQLQAVVVGGSDQRIEVFHRAEQRLDAGIVGDVVTEIGHWRGEDRRQPDRIDPQRFHIRQPLQDAGEIADAVTVGVLKGARVDLIEDAVAPPITIALSQDRPQMSLARTATRDRAEGSDQQGFRTTM